ncbi:MAG: DNA-binding response regulator [Bacteroidetes bacterium]|nr:MAG: DNA-binding response regulator [Bacteroidota bacterium]
MAISVGIVDDNPKLLESIKQNFSLFDEVEVAFTAVGGVKALSYLEDSQPDVILMDIEMPGIDGIETTKRVVEKYPNIKVMMLTVFDQEDKIFSAVLNGASGYILKDEKPARIVQCVEEVMDGGAPMSPKIAFLTLKIIKYQQGSNAKQKPESFGLTAREMDVLELVAKAMNYQEIAEKLFVSPKTVRKHIENIYHKLHVHNKLDAVKIGMENKWF